MSVIEVFDQALKRLAQRQLCAVSIVAAPEQHDELAAIAEWPVTRSPRHISFRGIPTFRAEKPGEASIVGRANSGSTTRIPLQELTERS